MHERRFHGDLERLRSPKRVALIDVDRVRQLSLEGIKASTMLDIGVGSGLFAETFSQAGLEVSGIDPVSEMIAAATRFVPAGHFRLGSAEQLPYPDESFDIVFLGHVLHETDHPLIALQEAKRVAIQRIVILEWPYRKEEEGPPIEERITPESVMTLFSNVGLTNVERPTLTHMDLYRVNI
jgi:ubiquinone/menaquinone biosynthesis C-methylase UbiE